MKYIDLHTHTNYSDGGVSLDHSLKEAEAVGLSLFSVSDHNTVAAYSALDESRHLFSGAILPAVELSTTFKGDVIEILGYGIDVGKMSTLIGKTIIPFTISRLRRHGLMPKQCSQRESRLMLNSSAR